MNKTITLIGAALLCFISTLAATITHTATVFPQLTNWNLTNSVPQFDPALGTLTNVSVTVAANANSAFYFESLDTIGWSVTASSIVTTSASASTLTASTTFTNSHTQSVTAADGVLDYGGTSGFTVQKSGSAYGVNSTTSVAPFIGTGTVPLSASASAVGDYQGPGDYFFFVQTRASALVTVTYEFSPPSCPECPPACEPVDCGYTKLWSRRCR